LLIGKNSLPPRCESCRKRIDDWQQRGQKLAVCPHCGHQQDPATYDFKQSAGFGRFLLKIENIFPQEAIPSQRLLNILQQACNGATWHYFYQQD
jgi:NAD-dependent SIR2 family protein deacetylase